MPQIVVRPATAADAPGIAHVHVQAWREAYARQLPAELLAGLDEDRRAVQWERIVADDATTVMVAVEGDRVVGWATASDAVRDEDAPADREVEGIYVLAAVYGSGAGQRLLDAVVLDGPAYLWMLDDNSRAESFYRRNGFARDGAVRGQVFGGQAVATVRLVRR